MDLRDPNVIKSLIDGERQRQTQERLSHLERTYDSRRSASGPSASQQIRQLQSSVFDLAEGFIPSPILGVARAGLEGVTTVFNKIFGLEEPEPEPEPRPRETQIQTAKDMARIGARKAVRRVQRDVSMLEREAQTEEMLAREGVGSLAELRARQRMGRR